MTIYNAVGGMRVRFDKDEVESFYHSEYEYTVVTLKNGKLYKLIGIFKFF
jgi:hypothetical protein